MSRTDRTIAKLCCADDNQITLGSLYKAHKKAGICTLCKDGNVIAFGTEDEISKYDKEKDACKSA